MLRLTYTILALIAVFGTSVSAAIDPVKFGAKGDGKHDDTVAIQKALDAAAKTDGTVKLGNGTYLITKSLLVPDHVSLHGEAPRWENMATRIEVRKQGFPAVRLVGAVASVKGIQFQYPENTNMVTPIKYPAAIQLESINPSVEDVNFVLAWDGISTKPGGQNAGQALFKNITGFVHNCGIRLDGPADIVHVDHVHLFVAGDNPGDPSYYYVNNRVAFEFGRVDGLFMNSCFMIFGETFVRGLAKTGAGDPAHSLGYAINNCWVEYVRRGFDIEGILGMSVTNSHILITRPDGCGFRFVMPAVFYNLALTNVQVRYAHQGSGPAIIYSPTGLHPLTKLSVTGSEFFTPPGSPSIVIGEKARNFIFNGNYVSGSPAIQIAPGAEFINITGNNVIGAIEDNSLAGASKNISGNIMIDPAKLAVDL
ncbi:MAG: glycosyl hydrolase family 28-related protein [Armatimonadota bacterium]